MHREFKVRGKPPMKSGSASAIGAKVENFRTAPPGTNLFRSKMSTLPVAPYPELNTERSLPFGFSARPKLSASSINNVGCAWSIK